MKTEKNILIAFLLNLTFSVVEIVGGLWTGSVAILSDAVHDMGDAMSVGCAYFLEKKSTRAPDDTYTYGYGRYSVIGSVITTLILLFGSATVIYHAVHRLIAPTPIRYDGMIVFAVIGVIINLLAAFVTREGDSLNQKAVNLHMLEDVLGWIVVLVGAVVMRFTGLCVLDPLLSIGVALFILVSALKTLKEALDLFLEKAPTDIAAAPLITHLTEIEGVRDVHHLHVWSMDGRRHYATMHIVADGDPHTVKQAVRAELFEHGIGHATLELESIGEPCSAERCTVEPINASHHHHLHH